MVGVPEWEFPYRWSDMSTLSAELLEERDRSFEQKSSEGFGTGCSMEFQYPYRWAEILGNPPWMQASLLESNMTALEQSIANSGGCPFEFQYRWNQIWEALVAGETWAIACAEENDRALEARFGTCSCGNFITTSADFIQTFASSDPFTVTADMVMDQWHIQASNCTIDGVSWTISIDSSPARSLDVVFPTGGDIDCFIDLATLAVTGTFPVDIAIFTGFAYSPVVPAGFTFQWNCPTVGADTTATPDPFSMSISNDSTTIDLPWINS